MSVNKVILLGNLGGDPELKYTPSGAAVCQLSVATNEVWKDKNTGQRQERTEWHRVVVWGKQAENCNQYLAKGRKVYVEGKLQTRNWDDKDGNKRYTTEILANNVVFIDGQGRGDFKAGASVSNGGMQADPGPMMGSASSNDQGASFTADDIPF